MYHGRYFKGVPFLLMMVHLHLNELSFAFKRAIAHMRYVVK